MLSLLHTKVLGFFSTTLTGSGALTPSSPSSTLSPRRHFKPTLCSHCLITDHPNPLKFEAAAYLQLQYFQPPSVPSQDDDWTVVSKHEFLIASPYNHPAHLLDLAQLDTPYQLFAKALTVLKPIRSDYATAPYALSFNWSAVVLLLQDLAVAEDYGWNEQRFHVVIFRSKLNLGHPRRFELGELDQKSHREAIKTGGLLKYWFGNADEQGHNLATCSSRHTFPPQIKKLITAGIWRNQEDSKKGSNGRDHAVAMLAAREIYQVINFKIITLRVGGNGATDWGFEGEGEF